MSARRDDFTKRFPGATRIVAGDLVPPLTGTPPSAPKRLRLAKADNLIASERLTGTGRMDEAIYKAAGFVDANDYWRDATAAPIELSEFVHRLAIHFLGPRPEDRTDYYRLDLEAALRFAAENSEPWLIKVDSGELRLRPCEAAAYLLAQPKCEHLVPPGLKAFLEKPSVPTQSEKSAATTPRKRSPRRDQVAEQMRSMDPTELKAMKQEAMVRRFDANRETCRKARDEVLSAMSANIDRQ